MQWPLLDLKSIYNDVQRNLAEFALHVEVLLDESEGLCPPDGAAMLAKIASTRCMVAQMLSPVLLAAIEAEQRDWDECEALNPH
jgi:hypothetical protein